MLYTCVECGCLSTTNKRQYETHVAQHLKSKAHEDLIASLPDHISLNKKHELKSWICGECGRMFQKKKGLDKHMVDAKHQKSNN